MFPLCFFLKTTPALQGALDRVKVVSLGFGFGCACLRMRARVRKSFIAFSLEMDFLFCEMMCKRQTTDRRSRKSKNFKQTQEKEEEKKKGKKYTRDKKATRFISTISLCTPHKTTRVTHKPAKRRQRRRIRRDENATKDDDDDDGVLFSRAGVWASFSFLFLLLFLFPLVLCFCV